MFNLFGKNSGAPPLPLVIGLNQVDTITPDGWNERLNAPSKLGEKQIERRARDIITKLSRQTKLSKEQFEYYSALKRYRLQNLLTKFVMFAHAGFKFNNFSPLDPFELSDEDVQEFVAAERAKDPDSPQMTDPTEAILKKLAEILSPAELEEVKAKTNAELARPPKVAFFGKTGVGKTTTVNALFNADFKTSHDLVGTVQAQQKDFELPNGGSLTIIDLPGYGRTIREDAEYEKIYQEILPECDVVFLAIQADDKSLADDQEMILKLRQWLEATPKTAE